MFRFRSQILNIARRFSTPADGIVCNTTPEMEELLKCRKDSKLEVCLVDDSVINPCWDTPSIIIIGAGLAGLTAANRLGKAGFSKITVVEATDRPGGRIHSYWMGHSVVEIGADLIEGSSISNGAYVLAAREGLIEPPVLRVPTMRKGLTLTSHGSAINAFTALAAETAFDGIIAQMIELHHKCGPHVTCGSAWDFISKRIDEEIQVFPFSQRVLAAKTMTSKTLDFMARVGGDLEKVSACQFGAKEQLHGGDVRIATGMVGILASLMRDMPKHVSIRYCKPVGKILWSGRPECPRVKVFCCDKDILIADYVIVTPSLGILKEAKTLFDPCLPNSKKEAIKDMGFGHVANLFLEYNEPFWVYGDGNLFLAWNYNDIKYTKHWTQSIGSVREIPNSQQILQVTIGGESAKCIETLSEERLAEDMTKIFRMFLNNSSIPYPDNLVRSKWSASPYFRGARSYYGLKTTLQTQCELGKPVPEGCGNDIPVLLFAGEATAIGQHGTMHGAISSGIREAERIIELTKKFEGKPKELSCKSEQQAIHV